MSRCREPPHRLVWWWWGGDEPATRVEFLVVAAPAGARVVVIESSPGGADGAPRGAFLRGGRVTDALGAVFAAPWPTLPAG